MLANDFLFFFSVLNIWQGCMFFKKIFVVPLDNFLPHIPCSVLLDLILYIVIKTISLRAALWQCCVFFKNISFVALDDFSSTQSLFGVIFLILSYPAQNHTATGSRTLLIKTVSAKAALII